MPEGDIPQLPIAIALATQSVRDAFYNSVPFQRVRNVDAAIERLHETIAIAMNGMAENNIDDALLAAAQICESRSRTLKSKLAQIEALQCGSAIHTGGRRWLNRMREERTTATPSPGAGVAEQQSVGTTEKL